MTTRLSGDAGRKRDAGDDTDHASTGAVRLADLDLHGAAGSDAPLAVLQVDPARRDAAGAAGVPRASIDAAGGSSIVVGGANPGRTS